MRLSLGLDDADVRLEDGLPRIVAPASPEMMAAAMRSGQWPHDWDFDRWMDGDLQMVSRRYWSPLAVAAQAADWFAALGIETVVDIGSGAGKFCVAAALGGGCRYLGLEQRPRLVRAARELAAAFGVDDRVRFENASFGDIVTPSADVYYLFNPFGENLFDPDEQLDTDVVLNTRRYAEDISAVEELLRAAPVGTYLLTYNGFGGRVPTSYTAVRTDRTLPCLLRMWRKYTVMEIGQGCFADTA